MPRPSCFDQQVKGFVFGVITVVTKGRRAARLLPLSQLLSLPLSFSPKNLPQGHKPAGSSSIWLMAEIRSTKAPKAAEAKGSEGQALSTDHFQE